jgi:hypothetical protein
LRVQGRDIFGLTLAIAAAWLPALADAAVVTLTPPAGTVVHPGDAVEVVFAVQNGAPIRGAVFRIKDRTERVDGVGPLTVAYKVPEDFAGTIPIDVESYGAGAVSYRASGRLLVRPLKPLASIAAEAPQIDLAIGSQAQIRVLGRPAEGPALDVTSSGADTIYSLRSGGNAVVSVSPEGLVVARAPGSEIVIVRNGALAAAVVVHVAAGNHPPKITPMKSVTITAGEFLEVRLYATDEDGDGVRFEAVNLPGWARLTNLGGLKGAIELRPTPEDAGKYLFAVRATDDGVPAMTESGFLEVIVKPRSP